MLLTIIIPGPMNGKCLQFQAYVYFFQCFFFLKHFFSLLLLISIVHWFCFHQQLCMVSMCFFNDLSFLVAYVYMTLYCRHNMHSHNLADHSPLWFILY